MLQNPVTQAQLPPVIECDRHLSMEEAKHVRDLWDHALATGKTVILPPGMRLVRHDAGQLQRIEDKLDILIAALAEDEEGPQFDLNGDPLPQERDANQEL